MKQKAVIVALIAALLSVCLFAGCGDWTVTSVDLDKKLSECDTNKKSQTVTDGARVTVVADVYQVVIEQCDVEEINVDYVDLATFTITVEEVDNEFKVNVHSLEDVSKVNIKPLYLFVRVPTAWNTCTYNVQVSVGKCGFVDVTSPLVTAEITSGSISLTKAKVARLDVSVKAGSILFDGDFDSVSANVNVGSVKCSATVSQSITMIADTGSVDFTLDCPDITAESNTGSVRGKVKGDKSLYTISSSVNTGSSNLAPQTGDGNHFLNVKTQTGSIKVSFEK